MLRSHVASKAALAAVAWANWMALVSADSTSWPFRSLRTPEAA
ncbi:hypothetical protein [Sphaerisporangium sp. TRM90804]|nr:hypothetical protein [Sphaerisporangium sp. TRM90804]MDH2425073.1 hypothetical protein [Sphaerisporangium sp. TRM90804]